MMAYTTLLARLKVSSHLSLYIIAPDVRLMLRRIRNRISHRILLIILGYLQRRRFTQDSDVAEVNDSFSLGFGCFNEEAQEAAREHLMDLASVSVHSRKQIVVNSGFCRCDDGKSRMTQT
jgi:hypothetical protein